MPANDVNSIRLSGRKMVRKCFLTYPRYRQPNRGLVLRTAIIVAQVLDMPESPMAAKKSPDAGRRLILPSTCGLNRGRTQPRIAARLGPAAHPVVSSLQNVRAAHRDELARLKCVESMGNQYCDTENDQNACNNRPHERSPRRHRLGGREPAQSKRISNIGGNCSALMILSNRKGPFPDSVNRCDLP
jgi:hypothetical protein